MPLDLTKPLLFDGKPCRLLASDLAGQYPLAIAYLLDGNHQERLVSVSLCGRVYINDPPRLTNAPERRTVWVNVYDRRVPLDLWPTREAADRVQTTGRIACVPLTYTVGEGL